MISENRRPLLSSNASQEAAKDTASTQDSVASLDQSVNEILAADGEFVEPAHLMANIPGPASRLAFHPIADIFPIMSGDRLQELAQNIKEHGLLNAIVLHEGKILDGRSCYLACKEGVEPKFEKYVGFDPLGFVVSRNLHRRHLSESQRAMVAARVADLKFGANQRSAGTPIGAAAKRLNVSARSVTRAKRVLRLGVPELAKVVDGGEVPVSAAAEISRMPAHEQRELVRAEGNGRPGSKQPRANRRRRPPREPTVVANEDKAATAAENERLKAELADMAERLHKAQEKLADQAGPAAVDRPPTEPTQLAIECGIPPILSRRALADEEELVFEALASHWNEHRALRRDDWESARPIIRERFIAAFLRPVGNFRSEA